jgi:hypothetical protein
MAVPLVVTPVFFISVIAIAAERAPMLAAIGIDPAHLAVGLPGVAPPVVSPVCRSGAGNGAGRDQGSGAEGENCKYSFHVSSPLRR